MKEDQNLLQEILAKLDEIQKYMKDDPTTKSITDEWIPRQQVQKFLDYGDTQISALQKSGKVVFAKVGKRIFFQRKSLLQAIENNRIN